MDKEKWSLRPNTQDEFIYNEVYVENCYRLPDDLTGKTVVDIGANIGAFTIACLDRGVEKVVAYEPDPGNFRQLRKHIQSHPLSDRVMLINAFLVGDNNPVQSMCVGGEYESHKENGTLLTGGVSLFGNRKDGPWVKTVQAGPELNMLPNKTIWVKLDCEGSEYQILSSALPWNRIERVFGEAHDCEDGRISRDTCKVKIPLTARGSLDGMYADRLVEHLRSVGYRVELVAHPEDPHLSLFFASREQEEKLPEIYDTHGSQNSIVNALKYADELEKSQVKTVCILTPFRNARRYLPLYFSQMVQLQSLLQSEGCRMRIVAAEGDSLDGTRERLIELAKEHNIDLSIVDTTHGKMKWASVEDPVRLKAMSDVMNKALYQVQESDDVVVWVMSDLKWDPQDILELIQTADHDETGTQDIYAPMVLTESGHFYDTWAFRLKGHRINPSFPVELNKDAVGLFEVDSAGTCLAMKAGVALDCRADKEEAVSFCHDAKVKGHRVWLDIGVKVYHAPLSSKRILWISDAVCISGFSRVAHSVFPLLVEAGYDLDIIALNYFGDPHNFPYTIYPASVQGDDPSGNLRAKYLIYQAHKEDRPYDLIVKLDDPWNVKGLTRALESLEKEYEIPSPPVLAWVTVDGRNPNGSELNFEALTIVASTEFGYAELMTGGLKGDPTKDHFIHFGVDTSIFKPLDKALSRSLVSSKEIPMDAFIVGYVGTNQLRKRLDLVLAYFADWISQYNVKDAYLYLCLGLEDNSGCDIKSLVKYYGLQSRVILNTSLLNDQALAYVYSSFDVFMSMSQGEGFGLPCLEALACGVPCIVPDWSGYSSWVAPECAYKIECTSTAMSSPLNSKAYVIGGVADRQETVGALQKLYLYPELREKMGKAGIEFAQRMSWKETGDRLIKEIELVLSRPQVTVEPKMEHAG